MAITRNRARRRSDRAELAALLKFFPHFPDPSWYERYWYALSDGQSGAEKALGCRPNLPGPSRHRI
jgi:hypothetical protein